MGSLGIQWRIVQRSLSEGFFVILVGFSGDSNGIFRDSTEDRSEILSKSCVGDSLGSLWDFYEILMGSLGILVGSSWKWLQLEALTGFVHEQKKTKPTLLGIVAGINGSRLRGGLRQLINARPLIFSNPIQVNYKTDKRICSPVQWPLVAATQRNLAVDLSTLAQRLRPADNQRMIRG